MIVLGGMNELWKLAVSEVWHGIVPSVASFEELEIMFKHLEMYTSLMQKKMFGFNLILNEESEFS